ncbi:hypothetical protein B296_00042854 [Ensete ventricosum]|uniref:Secreted protein n=1 Tax=Ensete ventricosum TaxID=4639 RepID=A0A426YYC1_ENSVE|nr:hypothetical protein B296_00042854 [Ensete ventricosum]
MRLNCVELFYALLLRFVMKAARRVAATCEQVVCKGGCSWPGLLQGRCMWPGRLHELSPTAKGAHEGSVCMQIGARPQGWRLRAQRPWVGRLWARWPREIASLAHRERSPKNDRKDIDRETLISRNCPRG